jgi:hypothetical protein
LSYLEFALVIENTYDIDTKELLIEATVKVIGTDGSQREFFTDSSGKVDFISLLPETSYSIVVEKKGYYVAKGKETTVKETESKKYVHEYALQKLKNLGCPMLPVIYFMNNEVESSDTKWLINLLNENPSIIMQIQGFRDVSEKNKISKQRAENYVAQLIEIGIDKDRFVVVDGGIRTNNDAQENRIINFKVLSTDFLPK